MKTYPRTTSDGRTVQVTIPPNDTRDEDTGTVIEALRLIIHLGLAAEEPEIAEVAGEALEAARRL